MGLLDKGKVATTQFTLPIQVILNAGEILGSSKKRTRSGMTSCPVLALLTFESCNRLKELLYLRRNELLNHQV